MDFFLLIEQLSERDKKKLYKNVDVVKTLFRMFPSCSQQVLIRILHAQNISSLDLMGTKISFEITKSIEELKKMGILIESEFNNMYQLEEQFRDSLGSGLITPSLIQKDSSIDPINQISIIEDIKVKSTETWETIIAYILQFSFEKVEIKGAKISDDVIALFFHSGLLTQYKSSKKRHDITKLGYQFLFESRKYQLWTILKSYMGLCEKSNISHLEALSFLLCLSFHTSGKLFLFEEMSAPCKRMVIDWAYLGLLYRPDGKQFYTTPITSALIENDKEIEGSIIVENNFRLYAYANSYSNYIPIISLFAEQLFKLPNMMIFHITRNTVINCLNLGVKASHINSFISRNIHPKTTNSTLEIVKTQITQWETEKERIKSERGILYDGFNSKDQYISTRDYTIENDFLIWSNDDKQFVFAKEDSHPLIRDFIKSLK